MKVRAKLNGDDFLVEMSKDDWAKIQGYYYASSNEGVKCEIGNEIRASTVYDSIQVIHHKAVEKNLASAINELEEAAEKLKKIKTL